jgi:hypothetical protein
MFVFLHRFSFKIFLGSINQNHELSHDPITLPTTDPIEVPIAGTTLPIVAPRVPPRKLQIELLALLLIDYFKYLPFRMSCRPHCESDCRDYCV